MKRSRSRGQLVSTGDVLRGAITTLDPNNGLWTLALAFNSTRGVVLMGLTRGKEYYVQSWAVAAGQNYSPWSDLASTMVN